MKRILLLDDSPTIQRVVTLSFASTKGYEVKCASNLEAAKKCLAEGRPDALIAYVRFSGDASPEFFKTLGIPNEQILLLAESRENLEPFERAGLTQFVRKPFHTDELKKAILSIIGDDSISAEHISTPTLNNTPPPPAFRPATTISMEALEKTFNRSTDSRQQQRNSNFETPGVPRQNEGTTMTRAPMPPPPPPSMLHQQMMAPPPPPPPMQQFTSISPPPPPTRSAMVPPPPPPARESSHNSSYDSEGTQMRRVPPPPPPPIRRETQVQPLVSRSEQRPINLPPPPPLPSSNSAGDVYDPMSAPDEHTESTERESLSSQQTRQATQPQMAFNMAQATIAEADARREVKEWIARELPRIARDVVREELQKLLK